jgi:hypothetical protein
VCGPVRRYPNTLEKDRDIAAQDPSKPTKGKKSKFATELLVTGADGAFPNADAWVGIFPEPVRQTQRSVACARVRWGLPHIARHVIQCI